MNNLGGELIIITFAIISMCSFDMADEKDRSEMTHGLLFTWSIFMMTFVKSNHVGIVGE